MGARDWEDVLYAVERSDERLGAEMLGAVVDLEVWGVVGLRGFGLGWGS